MKRLALAGLLALAGCGTPAAHIAMSSARLLCAIVDAIPPGLAAQRTPTGFDVLPDAGVRPVYPAGAR